LADNELITESILAYVKPAENNILSAVKTI